MILLAQDNKTAKVSLQIKLNKTLIQFIIHFISGIVGLLIKS